MALRLLDETKGKKTHKIITRSAELYKLTALKNTWIRYKRKSSGDLPETSAGKSYLDLQITIKEGSSKEERYRNETMTKVGPRRVHKISQY